MEYGVIYIKVLPPKGSTSEWLRYCYIFDSLPKSIQENIKHIASDINSKYVNDIVIPMDTMLHPGCTTTPEKVEEIAQDMYNQFSDMMNRQELTNCVRCVYSVGELSNINATSTHKLFHESGKGYDEIMLKVGRFLDESDEPGLFKI